MTGPGPVKRRFPKSAKPAPAVTRASIVNARKPPPVPKASPTGPSAGSRVASSTVPPAAAPTRSSSGLPADFFDSPSVPSSKLPADFFDSSNASSAKRMRVDGKDQKTTSASALQEPVVKKTENGVVQPANSTTPFDIAAGKVPEGFFDNVDADHRARGLEPPKVDIKEEYKEFQKSIKVDLVAADVQQQEDEEEASDIREELEEIEQSSLISDASLFPHMNDLENRNENPVKLWFSEHELRERITVQGGRMIVRDVAMKGLELGLLCAISIRFGATMVLPATTVSQQSGVVYPEIDTRIRHVSLNATRDWFLMLRFRLYPDG